AALGVAAQLVGLADRMLAMTVEYAKERRQFGVPIGSFQAVKHHLADVALALEFSRPSCTGARGRSRTPTTAGRYTSPWPKPALPKPRFAPGGSRSRSTGRSGTRPNTTS